MLFGEALINPLQNEFMFKSTLRWLIYLNNTVWGLLGKDPERFHNLFYLQTYLNKIFNTVTLENYAYDPDEKKLPFSLMRILRYLW